MTCVQCSFEFCWKCKYPWSECRGGPICRSISVWKHPIWGSNTLERAAKKSVGVPIATGVGCAMLGVGVGVAAVAGGTCLALACPVLAVMGAKKFYKHHKRRADRTRGTDLYLNITEQSHYISPTSLQYDEYRMPDRHRRHESFDNELAVDEERTVDLRVLHRRMEELERSLRDLETITASRMEAVIVRDMQGRNRALMEQIRMTTGSIEAAEKSSDSHIVSGSEVDNESTMSDWDEGADFSDASSVITTDHF